MTNRINGSLPWVNLILVLCALCWITNQALILWHGERFTMDHGQQLERRIEILEERLEIVPATRDRLPVTTALRATDD